MLVEAEAQRNLSGDSLCFDAYTDLVFYFKEVAGTIYSASFQELYKGLSCYVISKQKNTAWNWTCIFHVSLLWLCTAE